MRIIDWTLIIQIIVYINEFAALITVFSTKRDIAATWAWILVLTFLPVFGFIIYAFVGRSLPKKRLFRFHLRNQKRLDDLLRQQRNLTNNKKQIIADNVTFNAKSMVKLFQKKPLSFLARCNDVQIYTEGNYLFHDVIQDIKTAKSSINIEFYTFYKDKIGHEILNLLVKKAQSGIKVKVIYDSLGSLGTNKRFFKPLIKAGGMAEPFLHTHSALMDFRLNFRDHRKIIVVDGKIGYIGGFNIGDQYLGRLKKFGHWRDTHLRIVGSGVFSLQGQFIMDWNVTDMYNPIDEKNESINYFPLSDAHGTTNMQIVESGPNSSDQQIKFGYLKLVQMAKKTCWIQTPYLIPDDSMLDALKIAAMSGVDVRIMIPCKPDHMFVYRATQYYADWLSHEGIKIYYYRKGFMHSKTVITDNKISSVGSANLDYRSFKLNFEINAFMYDKYIADQLSKIFIDDMKNSELQTPEMFEKQSLWLKLKQKCSRLLSPIL